MEKWLVCPTLPEYEANKLGFIRCRPFAGKTPYGGRRSYGGKAWTGVWAKAGASGRYIFRFRGKTYKVARIVCAAFHGSPPGGAVCEHLNENPRDNRPENLSWSTQKANLNRPKIKQYHRSVCGRKMRGGALHFDGATP